MKEYLKLNNEILNTYKTTGKIDREKDKLATTKYFLEEVNVKMRYFIDLEEKIKYLMNEGYYEKEFLEMYDFKFIKKIFKTAYSYNFRFPSFMSASKFYESYALKSRDGKEILEKYEDRVAIASLYLAQGSEELAEKAVKAIMQSYQPSTPSFLNAGKKARGELVSCFKLLMSDDMNNITYNISNALQLSKRGGGVGISISDLRPLGDPIKGILNRASGVIPVCKLLENSFSYANQLGSRNGSGVVWLNVFHGDIEDFISSKKPNADEKIRLATLSTGVIIPSIFFELMKKDKDIVLFSPYDIKKEYGLDMSEISITEMYYQLLDNPNIRKLKRINARKLYTEIKKSQFESGYPFEMYDDNVNKAHPLKGIGRVRMTNLCNEVLQVQSPSIIKDGNINNDYGLDVSCNLGSIDIHTSTKVDDFGGLIETSTRLLNQVSLMTNMKVVPSVEKGNNLMNSIGLGVMNLHGHLISNGIEYGSPESIEFIDRYMEAVNYYSLKTSNELARERGEVFFEYEKSDYASGEYFKDYISKLDTSPVEKVKKALGSVPLITSEMWKELKDNVEKYGVFNSYRLCIAPTGSISYVRNSTASISPVTELVETRDYGDSRTIYPMPFLTDDNKDSYIDAYNINSFKMIDLYTSAQKHIDQGISMTLYVTDDWTTEQLTKVYAYAHHKGIKTVYYVRQRLNTLDGVMEKAIQECESCSI